MRRDHATPDISNCRIREMYKEIFETWVEFTEITAMKIFYKKLPVTLLMVFAAVIMLFATPAKDYLFAGDVTDNPSEIGVYYNDDAVVVTNANRLAVATLWFEVDGGTPQFVCDRFSSIMRFHPYYAPNGAHVLAGRPGSAGVSPA